MNLDDGNRAKFRWKEFRVGDLFDIHPTKAIEGVNADECVGYGVPLVVNQSSNNGVVGMCDHSPSEKGGVITFSDTWEGETFFYQPDDFIGFAHVQGMYPKKCNVCGECLLFITTAMEFEARGRYSYGRKKRRDVIANMTIRLPADVDGNPDWQFMEDYIKSLHYKPLTTKNKAGHALDLHLAEWKEFRVGDLFDIHPTKAVDGVNADECVGYGVPLVVNQSNNNGVVGMCGHPPSEQGGIITFSDTWEGETFFYQPDDFIGFAHVQGMYPKKRNVCGECLLFIATVLEFEARGRYSYGRKKRRDTIANAMIKLPSDADGNPDWQFMEDYIKSLPYGDRLADASP